MTRAPTFVEKARLFPGCWFVVGQDTAERVVQERFYAGREAMLEALETLRDLGNRFLVAGRLHDGVFVGLHQVPVPDGFEDLFQALEEEDFRKDVSSTAIRDAVRQRGDAND